MFDQTTFRLFFCFDLRCLLVAFSVSFLGLGLSAAASEQSDAWQTYIETHAVALLDDQAVDTVVAKMEGRRLILLGETTHGTQEYYTWRADITQRLIERGLISFIAVEGDWATLYEVNRYVKGMDGAGSSADSVLAGLNRWPEWMWANPVIRDLAEWMREWNADRPMEERVGFYGIDVYGWGDSVVALPEFLDQLEEGWGASVEDELSGLRSLGGDSQRFVRAVMSNQNLGHATIQSILERLSEGEASYRAADPEAYLQALQSAQLISQAKAHLRQSAERNPRSWNPRAENFYATVENLFAHYGSDSAGVLWAHNTHVGDAQFTPMREQGLITVGQQAREALGEENTFILGFASFTGSLRAGQRWGSEGVVMNLPDAPSDTLDGWLEAAAPGVALLPLAAAREDDVLMMPAGHRAIGVVHHPQTPVARNFVPSVVPMRYDALLFIRETSALDALP